MQCQCCMGLFSNELAMAIERLIKNKCPCAHNATVSPTVSKITHNSLIKSRALIAFPPGPLDAASTLCINNNGQIFYNARHKKWSSHGVFYAARCGKSDPTHVYLYTALQQGGAYKKEKSPVYIKCVRGTHTHRCKRGEYHTQKSHPGFIIIVRCVALCVCEKRPL